MKSGVARRFKESFNLMDFNLSQPVKSHTHTHTKLNKQLLGSTNHRIYCFLFNELDYLKNNLTFIPFQSFSILLWHMQSSISSYDWKLDGKDLEGFPLQ